MGPNNALWRSVQGIGQSLLEVSKTLPTDPCLEDHPTGCKWLGSPPIYKPWSSAIYKGNNPILRGRTLTMVTNHLLNGMILQVEHTPNPQPTVYEGIPFIWGFGDVWGMLQRYVGFPLESWSFFLFFFSRGHYPRHPGEYLLRWTVFHVWFWVFECV